MRVLYGEILFENVRAQSQRGRWTDIQEGDGAVDQALVDIWVSLPLRGAMVMKKRDMLEHMCICRMASVWLGQLHCL